MDLRAIINNEGVGGSKQAAAPATPVQPSPQQQQYREYSQPPSQGSKHPSQDYSHHGQAQYASPTSYRSDSFHSRPSQPSLTQQPPQPQHDVRSPGPSQYSIQSPYRHTPSGSMSGGYPFPQSATPQSPAQHQPYPPASLQQRDSYPQNGPPPPHLQHQGSHQSSYGQPSPQTPTVGTPGQTHQYLQHQRSQSSHSTSTPTSAQSQQPFYNQYPQDSPVSASAFPPQQLPQHHRQQSQPGTPLGPPISIPRQPSGGFQHPTSPYQQRPPSSGLIQAHPGARSSPSHQIPHQVPRQPSTPSAYDSHRNSIEEHRRSQSSRERSLSVSPKTQVYNLPPRTDMTPQPQPQPVKVEQTIVTNPIANIPSPIASTKRKMEDRESSEPLQRIPATNGHHQGNITATASPQQPLKKRIRYTEPPIWAQSILGRNKKGGQLPAKRVVNGAQPVASIASAPNGHPQAVAAVARRNTVDAQPDFSGPLGQWEPSITGKTPMEEISKQVADWLFLMVVNRPDAGELHSRGVEFEIEAKFGQFIDTDRGERFSCPVITECILSPNLKRVAFKSSMTETQHQKMNEYLNQQVVETDPRNPNVTQKRVQIQYTHRRERDTFYELPLSEMNSLPPSVRAELTNNKRHGAKVRVTHDQRTNQELAKIIKVRIADLSISLPNQPLDCRISVNLEMKYDGDVHQFPPPTSGDRLVDRNKDRLSYKQPHYQVDLTQVTIDPGAREEKEHELEIEVNASSVIDQGRRAASGQPHKYSELIEGFVNNIRVLARAVPEI